MASTEDGDGLMVRYVVNTHFHCDHGHGNEVLASVERTNAMVS